LAWTDKASASPLAEEALERIGVLYAIEAKLRDLDDETRHRERERHLAPKLDELKRWLDDLSTKVLGNSGLAGAIRYTRRRWSALARVPRPRPPPDRQQPDRTPSGPTPSGARTGCSPAPTPPARVPPPS